MKNHKHSHEIKCAIGIRKMKLGKEELNNFSKYEEKTWNERQMKGMEKCI